MTWFIFTGDLVVMTALFGVAAYLFLRANPAPWWWFALLLGLLVFTVLYLILYPGLGDYPGMLRWTQETQIQQSAARDHDKNAARRARWQNMTAAELVVGSKTLAAGRTKYAQFCAACHGPGGKGNPALGAPDLTDAVWFYGNTPAALRAAIRHGRSNQMPAQGQRLPETHLRLLVAYLLRHPD